MRTPVPLPTRADHAPAAQAPRHRRFPYPADHAHAPTPNRNSPPYARGSRARRLAPTNPAAKPTDRRYYSRPAAMPLPTPATIASLRAGDRQHLVSLDVPMAPPPSYPVSTSVTTFVKEEDAPTPLVASLMVPPRSYPTSSSLRSRRSRRKLLRAREVKRSMRELLCVVARG
jgi:hypothetical protein